jgi:hypothetical protein
VVVDYFTDCAETARSMTKTFTNQIAIAGASFSDAGDSGALVVDSANAEPVGLFFAGGTDTNGVEHAIANPVSDVLGTLDNQVSGANGQTTYSFVGGQDHPVSCLSYDGIKSSEESASAPTASLTLPIAERERTEAALPQAQLLLNPANGIVRAGIAASRDHPGTGAVAFYVEPAAYTTAAASIPAFIGGVPTIVLPANGPAAEPATLPAISQPRAASLNQALTVKQRIAANLLKSTPAIFGVGIGQSLDNPSDAALILFADRRNFTGSLPESIQTMVEGIRVRTILMDRLHVTRAHGSSHESARPASGCFSAHPTDATTQQELDHEPVLMEDRIQLPE